MINHIFIELRISDKIKFVKCQCYGTNEMGKVNQLEELYPTQNKKELLEFLDKHIPEEWFR